MDEQVEIMEPRRWRRNGWNARVIKNEDDDGWAVEMTRDGDPDPALVGPWTMGRDKKNPKPLDINAFNTLVKTASEVIRRHEHAALARLHRAFMYTRNDDVRVRVELDIVPDEDDPHAILKCTNDQTEEPLYRGKVAPNFKMNAQTVEKEMKGRN